jgi:hypothetical protein
MPVSEEGPSGGGELEGLRLGVELQPPRIPGSARAVRVLGSTPMDLSAEQSMTTPPSHTEVPGRLCPPPRTAMSQPFSREKPTTAITSAVPVQRAISPGRRSTIAL